MKLRQSLPFVILGLLLVLAIGDRIRRNLSPAQSALVSCKTTKGDLDIVVHPDWSPRGAERFLALVDDHYLDGSPFYRCVENFVCQVGAVPSRSGRKTYAPFPDDPPRAELREFKPGYVSFAGTSPNSRTSHWFIALGSVSSLGKQPWETPFATVTESSMTETVSKLTTVYGDMPPFGHGPDGTKVGRDNGLAYLHREFPLLDYIQSCARK